MGDHRPAITHSRQGVQHAAAVYVEALKDHRILISVVDVAVAWQNGYAERSSHTIGDEAVDLSEYGDCHEAYRQIEWFLDHVYMHKRVDLSLGYLTPIELAALAQGHAVRRIGPLLFRICGSCPVTGGTSWHYKGWRA